jgi:hypothetical protein
LTEVEFFPAMVFPFVKSIENDDLIIFEIVVSILMHWCKDWFKFFPHEPVDTLQLIEDIIDAEDMELAAHFKRNGFNPQHYAWPLVQNLFSEVMPKDEWFIFLDFVFTFHEQPNLIIYFTASYIIHFREDLLQVKNVEDLQNFVYRENEYSV